MTLTPWLIWITQHWLLVLVWASIVICTSYIIGAAVSAIAFANEARKADAQRQVLERALEASQRVENDNLRLLRASRPARAAGLRSDVRRVS